MSFELYEYKIEDLGKVITGKTPPSKISDAFSAQGIPFVTPKDMDGRRLIDKTERYLSSQGVEAVGIAYCLKIVLRYLVLVQIWGKRFYYPVKALLISR